MRGAFASPRRSLAVGVAIGLALFAPRSVIAQALIAPGDGRLRADVELLADSGTLDLPTMTWPIPADDILQAMRAARPPDESNAALAAAWRRVESRLGDPTRGSGPALLVSGARDPIRIRTFEDTPRTSGEIAVRDSWSGDELIAQLQVAAVAAPQDRQAVRLDGSYVDYTEGNWLIGVSAADRWWGPGWDGSLILSNAARPIPALMLERRTSKPFATPWLSWIGRWRLSALLGQLEQNRLGVHEPLYLAGRLVAKPTPWFELAASRSIIFCGTGRSCGVQAWVDALLEHQNPTGGEGPNRRYERAQLAGFDLRLNSPWQALPVAAYGQMIGEDASGGIPFKYLGLFGVETWATTAGGATLRLRGEFADTSCSFYRSTPIYDCAYHDALYAAGIRYRGAPIGDSLDADARVYSAGADLTTAGGTHWSLLLRTGRLNRGGTLDPTNSVAALPQTLRSADLGWHRSFGANGLDVDVGFERRVTPALDATDNSARGSLRLTHAF